MDAAPVDIVDRGKPRTVVVDGLEDDRCFTCGAEAFVYAKMPSGRAVAYCGHHGTAYWEQLNVQASKVIDMRHLIGVTFDEDDD